MSYIKGLHDKKLFGCPKWMPDNVLYEVITGSYCYGVSNDTSDMDIVSVCVPPKSDVFPFTDGGHIYGFGDNPKVFEQYIQHGIQDPSALGGKGREYDITCFSIVKFFNMCMNGNPNMLDILYVPYECITHTTNVGKTLRDNAYLFLSKRCFNTFARYAHSQLHKIHIKNPQNEKRQEDIRSSGFDTKYAMNLVRLSYECQMILEEGRIDLRRHNEHLKQIRRGEIPLKDIISWFNSKEIELNTMYSRTQLPQNPDVHKIKLLLLECLGHHYGNLTDDVHVVSKHEEAIKEINIILERYKLCH